MSAHRDESSSEGASRSLAELVRLVSNNARLIALTTTLALAACVAWLAGTVPVYRATATLLLDDDRSQGGILGDLAMLTRPPMAVSEIEILRARSLAERTVDGRGDALAGTSSLRLMTVVDDEALRPFAQILGTGAQPTDASATAGRLFATIDACAPGGLTAVRVRFLAPDRVRLRPAGLLAGITPGGPAELEYAYVQGEPITYEGLVLRLIAEGDLTGRQFSVRYVSRDRAVARVLASTRVAETSRNSGVIELSFDDSDPRRAADVANALCRNYLDRSLKRGEKRASQTVDFIESQLTLQTEALSAAELEVVRLQKSSPQTIDIGQTAEAWIKELSEFEVERVRNGLARAALRETLTQLAEGRLTAVSRLHTEIADPLSLAYVQEIAALTSQSEQQDLHDTGPFKSLLQAKVAELRAQADAIALEIDAQRATVADLNAGDETALARIGGDARGPGGDPLTAAHLAQIAELSARLRDLSAHFTPEHPDVARVAQEIRDVEARLLELARSRLAGLVGQQDGYRALIETYDARLAGLPGDVRVRIDAALVQLGQRLRDHLQSRLAGLDAHDTDLQREVERIEARMGELPESERVLANPKRRLEAHSEIVKFLLSRQQEAQISRAATVANAEFIDTAVPPNHRHSPSVPLYLGGSAILGLLIGLGLALARDSIDPSITTAAELESALGAPVFGAVPNFRKGHCRVPHAGEYFLGLRDDPDGPIAEAYRSLRANLKFALTGERSIRTMACTSSTKGEGKSVTNIDLALAFALGEKRVLLVDADMRAPVVHRYFDLPLGPGLSDVLGHDTEWTQCVRKTSFENLDVLTAGQRTSAPGDLLASGASRTLLASLRERYDLVVFDLPPALAVADTEAFASSLDAMVLVCRSRRLSRGVIAKSAERLRSAGANLIGGILNADLPNRRDSKYGYGYGYGYGDDGTRSSKRARRKRQLDPPSGVAG